MIASIRSCEHILSCLYLMLSADGRVAKTLNSHCFLSPVEAVLKIFRPVKWEMKFHNLRRLIEEYYYTGMIQF